MYNFLMKIDELIGIYNVLRSNAPMLADDVKEMLEKTEEQLKCLSDNCKIMRDKK